MLAQKLMSKVKALDSIKVEQTKFSMKNLEGKEITWKGKGLKPEKRRGKEFKRKGRESKTKRVAMENNGTKKPKDALGNTDVASYIIVFFYFAAAFSCRIPKR